MSNALAQLSETRQRLLRQLLLSPEGCSVELLCERLRISHNAVRQHIAALTGRNLVARVRTRATGGRPQFWYGLTEAGRELFPRNYGTIAAALIAQLQARLGEAETGAFLRQLGANVAASQPELDAEPGHDGLVRALAERLDSLGYEAMPAHRDGELHVEAFNCVFHALARNNPQVCTFDLAYMEATTGHHVRLMECMVRGGHVCRFKLGAALDVKTPAEGPPDNEDPAAG